MQDLQAILVDDGAWWPLDWQRTKVLVDEARGPFLLVFFHPSCGLDGYETIFWPSMITQAIRMSSVQVQDSECQMIVPGTQVEALHQDPAGERKYYDATVISAERSCHSREEGSCQCKFVLQWDERHSVASPSAKVPQGTFTSGISNLCFFGGFSIFHPKVKQWMKQIERSQLGRKDGSKVKREEDEEKDDERDKDYKRSDKKKRKNTSKPCESLQTSTATCVSLVDLQGVKSGPSVPTNCRSNEVKVKEEPVVINLPPPCPLPPAPPKIHSLPQPITSAPAPTALMAQIIKNALHTAQASQTLKAASQAPLVPRPPSLPRPPHAPQIAGPTRPAMASVSLKIDEVKAVYELYQQGLLSLGGPSVASLHAALKS